MLSQRFENHPDFLSSSELEGASDMAEVLSTFRATNVTLGIYLAPGSIV